MLSIKTDYVMQKKFSYSCLSATIGFSLDALRAGYTPANKPTTVQIITPPITHAQGITKPVLKG